MRRYEFAPEFKVGDKVKRINGTHNNMQIGDVDYVTSTTNGFYELTLDLKKYGVGHDPKKFQIINETWRSMMEDGT